MPSQVSDILSIVAISLAAGMMNVSSMATSKKA